ncbi:MAG: TolC family protein [Pseudomonadota bacterium]
MTLSILKPVTLSTFILVALTCPAFAGALTLDQAIANALANSPVLGAQTSRSQAMQANSQQAGARANPELSIAAENILGDGPYEDMQAAEVTYGVSQLVEMPGKRSNRIAIAKSEETRAHMQMDTASLDLIRDVTIAYAEALAAIEAAAIQEQQQALAQAVLDGVVAKVEAGKEPPIQKSKAEIAAASSQIALDRARRSIDTKIKVLNALLGQDEKAMTLDAATLPSVTEPLPFEEYQQKLGTTPDALALKADVARAQSALSYEKANAVPDPTFNLGVRDFRDEGEQAFIAGVSLPIPVFNANRASIKRAGHELNATVLDSRSNQFSLESQLAESYAAFVNAYREAQALSKSVLPGAHDAFNVARAGYEAGKFNYLEMLDAQRTLFDASQQFNQSALDYQRQRAILERLSAVHPLNHAH